MCANVIFLLTGVLAGVAAWAPSAAQLGPAAGGALDVVGSRMAANTARDGDIATREEFDAAIASGDPARLRLFIARNPEHPLAARARAELDKLERK